MAVDSNKRTNFNWGAIDPITNGIGMLYNISSGIANQVQNAQNDKWNKQFAEKQFAYQQDLNRQIMEREDNAVQRRAADMKAAGISKNLAAGAPAQAQVMSSGNSGAVANSNKQFQQLQKMDIMTSYAQFKMIESETNLKNVQAIVEAKREGLVDEQTATERINQLVGKAKARNLDADTEGKGIQNKRNKRDYEIDKDRDTKSTENESSIVTSARSIGVQFGKFALSLLGAKGKDNVDTLDEVFKLDELENIFNNFSMEVYNKHKSLSSVKANKEFEKFLKAYWRSIPGNNSSEKMRWIDNRKTKARW